MAKPNVKIVRDSEVNVSYDADFDGTESEWFDIGGEQPVLGMIFNLSDAATLTFQTATDIEGNNEAKVYGDDGSELSIATGSDTDVARFMTELAPFRFIKVTASASQTNAVIRGFSSS